MMMLLALRLMMRWLSLSDSPFVSCEKRGSSFVYESSHVVRRRARIGID